MCTKGPFPSICITCDTFSKLNPLTEANLGRDVYGLHRFSKMSTLHPYISSPYVAYFRRKGGDNGASRRDWKSPSKVPVWGMDGTVSWERERERQRQRQRQRPKSKESANHIHHVISPVRIQTYISPSTPFQGVFSLCWLRRGMWINEFDRQSWCWQPLIRTPLLSPGRWVAMGNLEVERSER
jgi:hypothetical protein